MARLTRLTDLLNPDWGTHNGRYVLVGQTPVPEPNLMKWAFWFENSCRNDGRRVAKDELPGCVVSTVFLGLDHNFFGDGPPILFETMVFADAEAVDQYRCSTWAEAEAQHQRVVAELKAKQPKRRIRVLPQKESDGAAD